MFLYLSGSGHCISTTDITLGISLSDHNIKVKNRSEKNASFKIRSTLRVERKPLKNPRSFCQAYELQITDMLAQENPYLPNACCYLLCDVSCRCQAVVSLADITDFLGQANTFPERQLYSGDSWK